MAMSDEHKAALAQGRQEARAIKAYLGAVSGRKRGRPVTRESLMARIERLDTQISSEANLLKALDHRQARIEAEQRLAVIEDPIDLEALEAGFVAHAAAYSERKGISYTAWREAGVPAAALKKAGIARTG
ncbi:MAG: hypothetical protein V3S62_00195 [Acidimicrobiia bacterium]